MDEKLRCSVQRQILAHQILQQDCAEGQEGESEDGEEVEDEEADVAEGTRVRIYTMRRGEDEEQSELLQEARSHWDAFFRWLHFQTGVCGPFDETSGRFAVTLDRSLGGGLEVGVTIMQVGVSPDNLVVLTGGRPDAKGMLGARKPGGQSRGKDGNMLNVTAPEPQADETKVFDAADPAEDDLNDKITLARRKHTDTEEEAEAGNDESGAVVDHKGTESSRFDGSTESSEVCGTEERSLRVNLGR